MCRACAASFARWVGLVLDQFFGTAVQKTDMRVDTLDDFTVELQYETQYAVSRRINAQKSCLIFLPPAPESDSNISR
jgi:hypothetical protein